MIPYVTRYVSKDELALFVQIKKAVEKMHDPQLGTDEEGKPIILSCHMLARAAEKIFPVSLRDGYFAGIYEHSWVETFGGHLIDLYPIAVIGGPIMYEGSTLSPQKRIYRRASTKKLSRGRFGKNSFRRSVRRVAKALRDVLSPPYMDRVPRSIWITMDD